MNYGVSFDGPPLLWAAAFLVAASGISFLILVLKARIELEASGLKTTWWASSFIVQPIAILRMKHAPRTAHRYARMALIALAVMIAAVVVFGPYALLEFKK